jgi:hypothetical protein
MSPLAQRILNAYDGRDRDQLQRAVDEVDQLVMRQRVPAPGPIVCTCGADDARAPVSHHWNCPLRVWERT